MPNFPEYRTDHGERPSRPNVADRIVDIVENRYGPLSLTVSTLVYEYGTGAVLRTVYGYEIGAEFDGFVVFLPVKYDGSELPFNGPKATALHVLQVNKDRVVSIVEEARIS
ncbi:hypothetical protein KNU14_gp70 [Gordonia phage Buggaboo]|uniref:Uncharacterized protein n=1 Tax=Gordonia phage Buggaboo TaxID=2315529 RepID=A0A386KD32_9CAUD|nr:hypothetical protein KNU14_gp70 [Gordonia phage Buggaboo]AVE00722.1 hypothetical protein SEA_SUPERSULLEY_70 [Gordonia phage SuperSulley]AYD83262.1 hypothetical protein SEA_BUGGABOO_70 [Gordonia phage Buggaboo]